MNKNIESILVSEKQIDDILTRLADEINNTYAGEEVIMVCILKGSVVFFTDLARRLNLPVTFEFMSVSSYKNSASSSGNVEVLMDLKVDIKDKNVLIIEDIIDTGNTIYKLKNLLGARSPKSLKLCCLLDKPSRRIAPLDADFVGTNIPDEFVVGYGLDYAEHFRQLPYVGILKRSVYEK